MNLIITEIDLNDRCKHRRYFALDLPSFLERERHGYWQVTLFNTFFHSFRRTRKRPRPNAAKKGFLYHEQDRECWEASHRILYEVLKKPAPPLPPTIVCNSIYEFFDHIGYDRKARRFVSQGGTTSA